MDNILFFIFFKYTYRVNLIFRTFILEKGKELIFFFIKYDFKGKNIINQNIVILIMKIIMILVLSIVNS